MRGPEGPPHPRYGLKQKSRERQSEKRRHHSALDTSPAGQFLKHVTAQPRGHVQGIINESGEGQESKASSQVGIDAKALNEPGQTRRVDPVRAEPQGGVAQGQDHERGKATTATSASNNMPPYPTSRQSVSTSTCLEVVPDPTNPWNPEQAPQATVTKSMGKIGIPFKALDPRKAGY
jgi:hypothetical protein